MFVPGGQIFVTQSRGGRGQTFLQPVGRGVTNIWLWWWQWQGGCGFVVVVVVVVVVIGWYLKHFRVYPVHD